MTVALGQFAQRFVQKLQFRDFKTKKPFMYLDKANTVENELTGEVVHARGGEGNTKQASFYSDKDGTLTVQSQVFSLRHLAMASGSEVVSELKDIFHREVLIIQEDTTTVPSTFYVTLEKTPIMVGSYDVAVMNYINGTQGDELTVDSVDDTTKKVVVSGAGVAAGEKVEAWYQWKTVNNGHTITVEADKFPKTFEVVGDTFVVDTSDNATVKAQIVYFKCQPQMGWNLSWANSGDPASLDITLDLLSHDDGIKKKMMEVTLYDE